MKLIYIAAVSITVAGLGACSVSTGNSRPTSWGKEGVSMLDYQTDGILCATLAERAETDNNAKTAGGMNGANGGAGAGGTAGGSEGSFGSLGGGTYRDTASPDMVSRAATQQRSREMQHQQVRNDALRSCLLGRGYTEFALTGEQRAKLEKLAVGSGERRDYLYKLGTDPEILRSAAVTRPPAAPAEATKK
jgi:hypothetical protein